MAYTVRLIGVDSASPSEVAAAERRFRKLLDESLGGTTQAYQAWLDANNQAVLGRVNELPPLAGLAVNRWLCAYVQARTISLAAVCGDISRAWFNVQIGTS